ncbi:MAG: 5'-nucleotidase C-terminal domain-containing protein [Thiobacillus sp.]
MLARLFCFLLLGMTPSAHAASGSVTFIHLGDLHGHLIPRPDMRAGSPSHGKPVGGLANVAARIKEIRTRVPGALLVNTGDTIQGSAEALYSEGQAMVNLLNPLKIDAFVAGNWDFVYGPKRFIELFAGAKPKAPWGGIAANLYYATLYDFPASPFPRQAGKRVLPPYRLFTVGSVKVAMIGLTADRPPQAVSTHVLDGFTLTPGSEELAYLVPRLRKQVDVLVLASERGLSGNLELVESVPGIDLVLSSDMHEETHRVLRAKTGTLLIEEGQDGTMVGEITLKVTDGRVSGHTHTAHRVVAGVLPPDTDTQARIDQIRTPFVKGPGFHPHSNPVNGAVLRTPIDTVIGHTDVALHRSNFADAKTQPAVIEGSSHNFLADAFRSVCRSDVGVIRGFRYGTHVAPGPVKLEDIYHFMPIGPQIACGVVRGEDIRWAIENSARGALTHFVDDWTGGWLFGWSNVSFDLDPYQEFGFMASNIRINGEPLDPSREYRLGGYWYVDNANWINRIPAEKIRVLRAANGSVIDGTDVVAHYFTTLPGRRFVPTPDRVKLLRALPKRLGVNPEIQPLRGAPRDSLSPAP